MKLLKCKQCPYTVEAEYTNKKGQLKDGYWKLRNHYQDCHAGSFWTIVRSLPTHSPEDPKVQAGLQSEDNFRFEESEDKVEELEF